MELLRYFLTVTFIGPTRPSYRGFGDVPMENSCLAGKELAPIALAIIVFYVTIRQALESSFYSPQELSYRCSDSGLYQELLKGIGTDICSLQQKTNPGLEHTAITVMLTSSNNGRHESGVWLSSLLDDLKNSNHKWWKQYNRGPLDWWKHVQKYHISLGDLLSLAMKSTSFRDYSHHRMFNFTCL